jgi:hypothetical protein
MKFREVDMLAFPTIPTFVGTLLLHLMCAEV